MAERKYRLYINRSDNHRRVTDENIWVGNTPNDGKSKVTSGATLGEEYSYVEFTWNELLDAIGESSATPTINITSDLGSIPRSGATVTYTINIQNGVYSRYYIVQPYGTLVSEDTSDPNSIVVKISYPQNDTGDEQEIDFVAEVRGVGSQSSNLFTATKTLIWEYSRWVLSDVDYVVFTYEWTAENGHDLDSFTFIDCLATSSTGWHGEYFESGVGYGNGRNYNPGGTVKGERIIGNSYTNSVIKFAGDNTDSGGEYTLIDFKKLNEYVEEGLNNGQLQPDGKIVVYLMGCWYGTRGNGLANASFTAYKGGDVYREILEEQEYSGKYKYSVSGDTEIKGTKEVTGVDVFSARLNSLDNSREALKTYTTMAAFVYDYSTSTFFLETDPERIVAINPSRYNYGLQLKYSGNIQINGSSTLQKSFSDNPTIDINIGDIQNEREYYIDFNQSYLIATSGSSPDSPISCGIRFDSCETDDPSTSQYDGVIQLQYINDHSYKVTIPAGHIYSGSYQYGYSVYYHLTQTNEFLRLVANHVGRVGYFKADLHEIQT